MMISSSRWIMGVVISLILATLGGQGATYLRAGMAAERAEKAMVIAEQSSQRIADLRVDLRQLASQLTVHDRR